MRKRKREIAAHAIAQHDGRMPAIRGAHRIERGCQPALRVGGQVEAALFGTGRIPVDDERREPLRRQPAQEARLRQQGDELPTPLGVALDGHGRAPAARPAGARPPAAIVEEARRACLP